MRITKTILILIILAISSCRRSEIISSDSKILMDTVVEIKISGENPEALQAAFSEFDRIDKKFNAYDKNSEVYFINSAKSKKIPLSSELKNLLDFSIDISSLTDGAFDATVFPIVRLWNVKESKEPPNDAEIRKFAARIGYKKISIKNSFLLKEKPDVMIDLGGIAKGYAADKAAEALKRHGVKSGLVNAGGDIRLFGDKIWSIGIAHPRKSDKLLGVLKLKDAAVATSGDYERYFLKNDKRYHHIINPKTGKPAEGVMSVTVVAPDCILADALSTAVFVMGAETGLKLVETLKDVECVIVDSSGKIFVSSGLKKEKFKF